MRSRLEITQAVLKEIPDSLAHEYNLPIDQVVFSWWVAGRSGGHGLRLSDVGFDAFNKARIEYYEFSLITDDMSDEQKRQINSTRFVLSIAKKLTCPFYIGSMLKGKKNVTTIRIYDDKIAMLMTLYGSFKDYMDSISNLSD